MTDKYIPDVREAALPEGGSWLQMGTEWGLVLVIPEWKEILNHSTSDYRYTWMYDHVEDAYLFCFQLSDGTQKAIAFPFDHAGVLLRDERATDPFPIVITIKQLTKKQDSFLHLRNIQHKKHPRAGW